MVEIKWKEPPPAVSSKHAAILGELKNYPGRWAVVQEGVSSTSARAPWTKLGCQVQVHRTNPGEAKARYDVYARWPEAKPKAEPKAIPVPKPGDVTGGVPPVQNVRPAGPGVYNPADRERRGVPPEGLHPGMLRR